MMVVGTPPNAARAERNDSENPHEHFSQSRVRQNRVVLLVMINDEEPQGKQSAKNTANNFADGMKIPKRSHNCREQKAGGGRNTPPTLQGLIRCILSGC